MTMPEYRLLAADREQSALLTLNGRDGKVLGRMAYPRRYAPVDMAAAPGGELIYMSAAGESGDGAVFAVHTGGETPLRLVSRVPHPVQFALSPDGQRGYVADPEGGIHAVTWAAQAAIPWGKPGEGTSCVGIAVTERRLYGAWEDCAGGIMAEYGLDGKVLAERPIPGIPTNICAGQRGEVLVTYTSDGSGGEGVAIFPPEGGEMVAVPVLCRECARGIRAYPCQAVIAEDGCTAYIVSEDAAAVTAVDLAEGAVKATLGVGRALSQLCLLPSGDCGLGYSRMFGELLLIDFRQGRLLAVSEPLPSLLPCMVVLA